MRAIHAKLRQLCFSSIITGTSFVIINSPNDNSPLFQPWSIGNDGDDLSNDLDAGKLNEEDIDYDVVDDDDVLEDIDVEYEDFNYW